MEEAEAWEGFQEVVSFSPAAAGSRKDSSGKGKSVSFELSAAVEAGVAEQAAGGVGGGGASSFVSAVAPEGSSTSRETG